jgi:hypothetical protein
VWNTILAFHALGAASRLGGRESKDMNPKDKSLHVNPVGANWEVESAVGTLGQAETKPEAEALATMLAEELGAEEVEVHTSDGMVEKKIHIQPDQKATE